MGLAIFELGWIDYTPLTGEAWMMIGYAWIAFAAGSAILILARRAVGVSSETQTISENDIHLEIRLLVVTIWILCAIALIGVLQHWSIVLKRYGSLAGVLLHGGEIYHLRTSGKLTGGIPYADSLALTASCLAGRYCGRLGRIKFLALLPLSIVLLDEVAAAARAKLLTAGLLFLSAYFVSKTPSARKATGAVRRYLPLIAVVIVLIFGVEFVRGFREGAASYYGMSKKFEEYPFIPPSIYIYASGHPGVFSAYLKAEAEHPFPGSITFAPLFRLLSRFGLADPAPLYQKFYNIPMSINTGTYLREIHAEFGVAGILVVPYLLGMMCTVIWNRLRNHPGMTPVILLSHLYVVVALTFVVQGTQLGFWLISLLGSMALGWFIERLCYRHAL